MNRNVNYNITNSAFDDYSETIWVYLKSGNTKGEDYDPYRNVGYTKTFESPYPVEAMIVPVQPNSLIMREIGLDEAGAIYTIIKNQDVNMIKSAEKIEYNEETYSVYNKALGNRIQLLKRPFGFWRVTLFRVGN